MSVCLVCNEEVPVYHAAVMVAPGVWCHARCNPNDFKRKDGLNLYKCEDFGNVTYWVAAKRSEDVLRTIIKDEMGDPEDYDDFVVSQVGGPALYQTQMTCDEDGTKISMFGEFMGAKKPGIIACTEF